MVPAARQLGELLSLATDRLARAGLLQPRLDAELLLAGVLQIPRLELYARNEVELAPALVAKFAELTVRREAHEPVQYLLGTAAFHQVELEVGPGVLIPRPETEGLVELALGLAPLGGTVLDLGTGSGAIALAMAMARPDLLVTATDLSPEALVWVKHNRARLGLEGRVELLAGDLFEPLAGRQFGLIVANLPYIGEGERAVLPREVREYEPDLALFAGADGLAVIRRAIAAAPDHLCPGGTLLLELAPAQSAPIAKLARDGGYRSCRFQHDLTGRPRMAIIER